MEEIRQIDEKIKKITHLTKDQCTTQKLTWIKMHELQKITLLGTSHILRKALSIK